VADLQRFSELFADITKEVEGLEQRKREATQEITRLNARIQFLTNQVAAKQADYDGRQQVLEQQVATKQQATQDVQVAIAEATEQLIALRQLHTVEKQALEQTRDQVAAIDAERRASEQALQAQQTAASEALATTEQQLLDVRQQLHQVQVELTTKEQELRVAEQQQLQVLADLQQTIKVTTDELAIIQSDVVQTQADLTVATRYYEQLQAEQAKLQEHARQLDSKVTEATKMLDARELSLQAREEQLAEAERRARNRGIMDNV
jgi:chromosome segregation ATPase